MIFFINPRVCSDRLCAIHLKVDLCLSVSDYVWCRCLGKYQKSQCVGMYFWHTDLNNPLFHTTVIVYLSELVISLLQKIDHQATAPLLAFIWLHYLCTRYLLHCQAFWCEKWTSRFTPKWDTACTILVCLVSECLCHL